jgi:hypothetical protein
MLKLQPILIKMYKFWPFEDMSSLVMGDIFIEGMLIRYFERTA